MTPKGANLQATDLLEISELSGTSYITKSITGQEIINASGGGGSQDLQQVTDIGQTSTNGIGIIDSDPTFDEFTFVGYNYIEMQKNSTGELLYLTRDTIEIVKSGGANGRLKVSNVTNNVTLEFPDKTTGSYTIATTADIPSGGGTVTSVDLTMPSAFTVTGNPITTSGTLAVAGAGVATQYIRGDGQLANFPISSGGGASVSYYLNGSVSQGTFGGVAMKEINKTPIIGAGTDFTIATNGYIQSFITDANDPNQLEIPAGNWNFETYFSASSPGGTPSFYVELYKWDGATLTLIASSSTAPEGITGGTAIDLYLTALAVPQTTLALTDRLAIRIYVNNSGRTIKLHTEDNHLSQIITTFSTGLTALNGLTAQVQNLAVGTSGTDFAISSAASTHTFNLPTASATNRGALSSTDWSTFSNKQNALLVKKLGASATIATTVESIIGNVEILGGTLASTDYLNIKSRARKTGAIGTYLLRYYLNTTSNSLTGATQIAISGTQTTTSIISTSFERDFTIDGGNLIGFPFGTASNDGTASASTVSSVAYTVATTYYIITTITLVSALDTASLIGQKITNF
jgi:hypothetical protein